MSQLNEPWGLIKGWIRSRTISHWWVQNGLQELDLIMPDLVLSSKNWFTPITNCRKGSNFSQNIWETCSHHSLFERNISNFTNNFNIKLILLFLFSWDNVGPYFLGGLLNYFVLYVSRYLFIWYQYACTYSYLLHQSIHCCLPILSRCVFCFVFVKCCFETTNHDSNTLFSKYEHKNLISILLDASICICETGAHLHLELGQFPRIFPFLYYTWGV